MQSATFVRGEHFQGEVKIGQVIRWGVYNTGRGIVFRIHGEQNPGSIRRFAGGFIATGGRAEFDIVFIDSPHVSRGIPESILKGVQWEISDEIVGPDEINKALHVAEHEEARKATEARQADERRAREMVEHAANNPHLITRDDPRAAKWSSGRLAAHNIRTELKRQFPGFKFSVTSDYNSVDIKWENGPTEKEVAEFTSRHSAGHFDGMTDCFEYDPDATFSKVFGSCRFVFNKREWTGEALRQAWSEKGHDASDIPDDIDKTGWPRSMSDSDIHWIRDAWRKHSFYVKPVKR